MSEYTPTTAEIRDDYVSLNTCNFDAYQVGRPQVGRWLASEQERYGDQFDRWLAAERASAVPAAPAFEYEMRVASADREGYYYTRWDRATPITATAGTKQEAVNKACAQMGDPARGRYWAVKVDKVREVTRG